MNAHTEKLLITGPAGDLEIAIDQPTHGAALRGVAVICHPNPTQGGTLDNKVVQALAKAFTQMGYRAVRFNYRGVGKSKGEWDQGQGELQDALAVVEAFREPGLPLALGGFSFGGYIASRAAQALTDELAPERLVLVGPAAGRFDMAPVPADSVVIHGEQDDVVPLSAVLDWARPQHLPVIVVPGVGHFFHGQIVALKNLVVRSWHAA